MWKPTRAPGPSAPQVDLTTRVGSLTLPNPMMCAAGTAGHGAELGAFVDLGALGAVVVKSLSVDPWPGNPAPRVHPLPSGMINSVGLQGPGLAAWQAEELPQLVDSGARVVVSIWGRSVGDFASAAQAVGAMGPEVVAVEVNLSCPNLAGKSMFAHDAAAAAEVMAATAAAGRPRWAKLSPNTDRLVAVAEACAGAGADALTLTNTLLGLVIDPEARRPVLGAGGGGVSGAGLAPIAVRAVWDVAAAVELPIIGAGGVSDANGALQLLMAGASAVQVGTATFADPRAPQRILEELTQWCAAHGVGSISELVGAAQP
ncbi:MAG: dihydroorotate dehydrogenase [Microthrixaceae bacterium]